MKKILFGLFVFVSVLGFSHNVFADSISNSCVITVDTFHNGNYGFLIGNTNSEVFDTDNSMIAIGNRDSELGWTLDLDDIWPSWSTATTIYWNYWTDPSATNFAFHNGYFYRYGVNNCFYIPFVPESCSDGIQNQDEMGIDIGGVCGDTNVVYSQNYIGENINTFKDIFETSFYQYYAGGAIIANPPVTSGFYVPEQFNKVRIKRISGQSCSQLDNTAGMNYVDGNFAISFINGVSDGDYCEFSVWGGSAPSGTYGSIYFLGDQSNSILDGSSFNDGISINGYNNTSINGGFAFQLCNNTCDKDFENKTIESCSDGIRNQDETGIDIGGVCSTSIYTGPTGIVFSDFNYVGFNPVGQRDILVSCANHVGDINSLYNNTTLGTAHTCTGGSFWLQYNMPLFGTSNLDPIPDGNYCIDFNGGDFIPCTDGEFIVANGVFSTELPLVSCFDGIQNQDETGIDNGGVCIFYTKIKNTNNGLIELMNEVSLDADDINKTLPEDWIVQVTNVRDPSGNPVSYGGYYWYEVTDPTDGVSGWMKGSNDTETTFYLPYDIDNQDEYEDIAVDQYSTMATRATRILEAINHYYNDSNTAGSLYSSDDNSYNKISLLKNSGFPEKLIWGIAVEESGKNGHDFNNEIVSFDYGHGIMQLTFDALRFEPNDPHSTYDNRGVGSKIAIPDCASKGPGIDNYIDCYTYAGTGNRLSKPYKHYQDNPNNPIYKYYTNTWQSIYANIKDALYMLSSNYNRYNYIVSEKLVNSVLYSADDIRNILTVRRYNGASNDGCRYVNRVATNLDNIGNYFSGQDASDISPLISKMHSAGSQVKCADLYSPGELSIQDSKGRTVGVVDGEGVNDFPIADYDIEEKNAIILAALDDDYKYNVVGTEEGTYGLDITIIDGEETITFEARDIVILPGQVHSYSVDEEALLKGKNGVTVSIDRNGDGKVDRIIKTGKKLSGHNYNLKATQKELKAFAKRNSKLIKKIISHKIKKLKTLKNYKHNN